MKKLLLTLTAVAGLTVASKAQEITGFQKGNFIIEGNLGLKNVDDKTEQIKQKNFDFNPKVGYFVTDRIAVGVKFNVGNETVDRYATGVERKNSGNVFTAGVFGRYYFLEVGNRFKTYADVNVDYLTSSSKVTVLGTTTKNPNENGFGLNGAIGANYFLTDKIAVNFAFANVIGFGTSKVDVDGAKASNSFNMNLNSFNNFFNTAQFGLTFKL